MLRNHVSSFALAALLAATATPSLRAGAHYEVKNLVSDQPGVAVTQDTHLINAWGMSSSSASPWWISSNGGKVSTLATGTGAVPNLEAAIPNEGSATGQVFAGGTSFGYTFIFASEDGTISAWKPSLGTSGVVPADQKVAPSLDNVYKGLAIDPTAGHNFLYAANFRSGHIDVFDTGFAATSLAGAFSDPTLPVGYAPFNIQNLGGTLYVTFAVQDAAKHDEVDGAGLGVVDAFDTNGHFLHRVTDGGPLNAPWGMALAPSNFGQFHDALLVGNFGDGKISAFNPSTGMFLGQLNDASNNPLVIDGLWGLGFGNGGGAGPKNTLFFAAGPGGEQHGLFGSINAVPEPGSCVLLSLGDIALLAFRRRSRRA